MGFCNKCGSKLQGNDVAFCNSCGTSLKNETTKLKPSIVGYIVIMVLGLIPVVPVSSFAYDVFAWRNLSFTMTSPFFMGSALYIVTFISFMQRKSWSLLMSVVSISFLNFSLMHYVYRSVFGGFILEARDALYAMAGATAFLLIVLLFSSIYNAKKLSLMKDDNARVLWIKTNETPSERDNTLFRAGCAIASLVMAVSLAMPLFSIDIWGRSRSFSLMDVGNAMELLDSYFPRNIMVSGVFAIFAIALALLILYIFILFCASFSKSKAVKTTLGITVAISILSTVLGARAALINAIEGLVHGTLMGGWGIGGFITNSMSGLFTSIFSLDIGIWVMIGALVAYILFASCQFSRIKKPSLSTIQAITPTVQMVKVRCNDCGHLNDDNMPFCNKCGVKLINTPPSENVEPQKEEIADDAKICTSCGTKIAQDMNFCGNCGTAFTQ